jgi:hypothetical protein
MSSNSPFSLATLSAVSLPLRYIFSIRTIWGQEVADGQMPRHQAVERHVTRRQSQGNSEERPVHEGRQEVKCTDEKECCDFEVVERLTETCSCAIDRKGPIKHGVFVALVSVSKRSFLAPIECEQEIKKVTLAIGESQLLEKTHSENVQHFGDDSRDECVSSVTTCRML